MDTDKNTDEKTIKISEYFSELGQLIKSCEEESGDEGQI